MSLHCWEMQWQVVNISSAHPGLNRSKIYVFNRNIQVFFILQPLTCTFYGTCNDKAFRCMLREFAIYPLRFFFQLLHNQNCCLFSIHCWGVSSQIVEALYFLCFLGLFMRSNENCRRINFAHLSPAVLQRWAGPGSLRPNICVYTSNGNTYRRSSLPFQDFLGKIAARTGSTRPGVILIVRACNVQTYMNIMHIWYTLVSKYVNTNMADCFKY